MKIIFMGTPEFAVPTLQALIDSKHEVVAVVTQPDKPSGRHNQLQESPVKLLAKLHNIPVYQFKKIRLDGVETINAIDADIIVTCAYGQILSSDILFAKRYGVINVHGSLLPKYRGASPIQSAIINGEKETGVTILQSDIGIDDGKMILSESTPINSCETYGELSSRLSVLGAKLAVEALNLIESKDAKYIAQDESLATYCKMFKADYGRLNFNNNAEDIVNLIHGINPSPIAFMIINGARYKVYNAHVVNDDDVAKLGLNQDYCSGQVVVAKSKVGLIIKCNDGYVSIDRIQAENGKILPVKDYLNGSKIKIGDVVENE